MALNAPSETVSCLRVQLLLPDHWQFRLKALIQPDRFCPLTTDKASHFIHLIIRDSDDSTLNKSDGSTKLNYALKQKWLSWRYDKVRNGPAFLVWRADSCYRTNFKPQIFTDITIPDTKFYSPHTGKISSFNTYLFCPPTTTTMYYIPLDMQNTLYYAVFKGRLA